MSDDFMDLLSGEGSGPQGQEEKGMEDLLGSLMGGGGAGGLGSLLGGLMGGGDPQSGSAGDSGDMAGMLGSLLGGGGSATETPSGAGDMLGGLMGGGDSSAGGGLLGSLLGGLLGGGGNAGQMSFGGGGGVSLPFAGTLAEKLGISEQMANMLIMGAIGLLTSSMAKKRSGGTVDVNSLTDPDFIRTSGVSSRLSSQMGISEDDAVLGLQQAMEMMMAAQQQQSPPPAKPKRATKKKQSAAGETTAPKKSSTKSTKSTSKKKSTKKESGSDFMDLLDDPNG